MELLEIFKHCPACGGTRLGTREGKAIVCRECGFVYYHNIAAAAAAIIECDEKILLTIRAKEPKEGMLDLPGGFADYGETIEESLIREMREELGIEIIDLRYLTSAPNVYVYKDIPYQVIDFFFTCRPRDLKSLRTSDEIAGVEYFEWEKVPIEKLAFESTRVAMRYYIERRRQGRERNK